ncbi:hypothetical protein FJZ31_34180 [Candidatus Poribacteria bacterium]|nr:hypothetical protein [Candidatus Poribacteria bacterium]
MTTRTQIGEFLDELPVIYEKGEPKAAVIDIKLLAALLERLDELEEKELLDDPKIVEGLMKAREHHLTGRITSHTDLIKELGLEDEL